MWMVKGLQAIKCEMELSSLLGDLDLADNAVANTALQAAHDSLALVLAVNGLRDRDLCAELIAKPDLTWAQLSSLLRSRSTAEKEVEAMRDGLNVESVRRGHRELTVGAADRRQWGRSGRSPARSPQRNREKSSRAAWHRREGQDEFRSLRGPERESGSFDQSRRRERSTESVRSGYRRDDSRDSGVSKPSYYYRSPSREREPTEK